MKENYIFSEPDASGRYEVVFAEDGAIRKLVATGIISLCNLVAGRKVIFFFDIYATLSRIKLKTVKKGASHFQHKFSKESETSKLTVQLASMFLL